MSSDLEKFIAQPPAPMTDVMPPPQSPEVGHISTSRQCDNIHSVGSCALLRRVSAQHDLPGRQNSSQEFLSGAACWYRPEARCVHPLPACTVHGCAGRAC